MAIQLIIDGYNFIGFHKGLSKNLEAQRNQLVSLLASYRQIKNFPICVVFDGWKEGELHQHFEMRNGIEVIYSRLGEKADQVIIRFIKRLKEQCVVVSSDHEIRNCAHQYGATALTIQEFNSKLGRADSRPDEETAKEEEDKPHRFGKKSGNPKKLPKRERTKQNKLKKL
ncbi:MAG: NYN domain-containing protein [Nitrospiria bacterium]